MTFGAPYYMPPPYLVLRRWVKNRVTDIGEGEFFLGHRPRWLRAWKPPVAVWKYMQMPHTPGIYRFHNREEALGYIDKHQYDMGEILIEMVPVDYAANDWERVHE